jgi:hypothetical protein
MKKTKLLLIPIYTISILFLVLLFANKNMSTHEKFLQIDSIPIKKTIYQIDAINLEILKKNPPILVITAQGQVNTGGWDLKSGELWPRVYIPENPPADGIYEFDFVATPPDPEMQVIQVLDSISAKYEWENFPTDLKGVKVYAVSNSKKKKI